MSVNQETMCILYMQGLVIHEGIWLREKRLRVIALEETTLIFLVNITFLTLLNCFDNLFFELNVHK